MRRHLANNPDRAAKHAARTGRAVQLPALTPDDIADHIAQARALAARAYPPLARYAGNTSGQSFSAALASYNAMRGQ